MIDLENLLEIHDTVVRYENALDGIRDINTLYSIIDTQKQGWYNGIDSILWISYSVCGGHIFSDGNKRTSFLVLKTLEEQGYKLDTEKLADLILHLATKTMTREEFFYKAHLYII